MSEAWRLPCVWCTFYVSVQHGTHPEPGAGHTAARLMTEHLEAEHGRTWDEYRAAIGRPDG